MKRMLLAMIALCLLLLCSCQQTAFPASEETERESFEAVKTTEPAQTRDRRGENYAGQWMDKTKVPAPQTEPKTDAFVITGIYDDCFFVQEQVSSPWKMKVNGSLPEEWCVFDVALIRYHNIYTDEKNKRMESDLLDIQAVDTFAKPVIYLYPEEEIEVSVELSLNGELTCTYPAYEDAWEVTAFPDGTLVDQKGQSYNYLYWEGKTGTQWDMTKGFCVKGEDTAAFLEDALSKLGLTRREANEFIVYWLPLMQENPYNVICFQTEVYEESAKLTISPKPDTLIRVYMVFEGSQSPVELELQTLSAPPRTGFVAVEWGGTQIK